MIKTLYGPHIMTRADQFRNQIEAMQPAVALMLHPKAEDVQLIRSISPETIQVGRFYLPDQRYSEGIKNRPADFAKEIHDLVMATDWWDKVDYVQTNNEVMQSYHWVDGNPPSEIQRLALYTTFWMNLAKDKYHIAYGSFSVTRPDIERAWPSFYPVMEKGNEEGHILLLHEYGWPDFWSPPDKWYMGKFAHRVWPQLPDHLKVTPWLLGEFGYDRLIQNIKGGWRSTGRSAYEIALQLEAFHNDFNSWRRWGMNFLGACMFCWGDLGWSDYDFTFGGEQSPVTHYLNLLPENIQPLQEYKPVEPEPPIDPPVIPGDTMIEIIDSKGNPQTMEWLIEHYGDPFHSKLLDDEKGFHVYRIQANETGESSIKIDVRNEEGQPNDNQVAFWWKDAPKQSPGCATQPYDRFIHQGTGSDGLTSFALGPGAYYLPPDNGYHKIWVCSSLPSDVVNAGMLANTNHHHLDFWFGIHEGEGTVDPEPDPDPDLPQDDEIKSILIAIYDELKKLRQHLGA